MLMRARQSVKLVPASARAFGAPAADPNHVYVKDKIDSQQSTFKQPSEGDMDFQMAKKSHFNEKLHRWIFGKWDPTRDDILDNSKYNQYSAYHVWGT